MGEGIFGLGLHMIMRAIVQGKPVGHPSPGLPTAALHSSRKGPAGRVCQCLGLGLPVLHHRLPGSSENTGCQWSY